MSKYLGPLLLRSKGCCMHTGLQLFNWIGRLNSRGNDSFIFLSYYAPNFEEAEGVYWFGPVRVCICLSVRYALHTVKNG